MSSSFPNKYHSSNLIKSKASSVYCVLNILDVIFKAEFALFGPELKLTGNNVFNVIFAAASQLAIAILRRHRYCLSTGNSDFTLKSLLPTFFNLFSFPTYKTRQQEKKEKAEWPAIHRRQ